jgi:hypothetical protein
MRNLGCVFTLSVAILGMHAGTASGARWTEISTGLTGPVAVARSLVIDHTGSTLYVVTGDSAVFKSTDSGSSWKVLGGVTAVGVLALDPTSASTIYAGTARGVFKSTNGGESWDSAGLAGTGVITLAVDPITPSTLYAGAFDDRIFKSTDGGGSWTAFSVGVPPVQYHGVSAIVVDPVNSSTLYVIGGGLGSAFYKSTDGSERKLARKKKITSKNPNAVLASAQRAFCSGSNPPVCPQIFPTRLCFQYTFPNSSKSCAKAPHIFHAPDDLLTR